MELDINSLFSKSKDNNNLITILLIALIAFLLLKPRRCTVYPFQYDLGPTGTVGGAVGVTDNNFSNGGNIVILIIILFLIFFLPGDIDEHE